LLQAVAYRLQERVLGGLKPSTRRLLERAAEDKVDRELLFLTAGVFASTSDVAGAAAEH
jgi:hypothetical protein